MAGRRRQDWEAILNVVGAVSAVDDLDEFGATVLTELASLVPSDKSAFNEVDPMHGRARADYYPDSFRLSDHFDAEWQRLSHQNPIVMHMLRTGDGSARRISDFLSDDEFHNLKLYTDVYRHFGIEYQIAIGLPSPQPLVLGVALTRPDGDFADEEVSALDVLRPHLAQAYRRTQLITEQRAAMSAIAGALQLEGRAFYVLGGPLEEPALTLVQTHFGPCPLGLLPDLLARWAEEERQAFTSGGLDRLRQPIVSYAHGRRLTVRYLPGGRDPDLLSFDERVPEDDARPLRRLGLSDREAEVLWWLSRGGSTVEIGESLGISPSTVKKHLERVYRKLGVTTRTAAVAQAFDALTVAPPTQ